MSSQGSTGDIQGRGADNGAGAGERRRIVHVDMDAFYASIEQRDSPEKYAGEPIAVGGTPPRGVVQTASYEARPYGVHSAQPAVEAERKCPDLIFVSPRMEVYQKESERIREILRRYTDLIEPLSLDEAYLDVNSPKKGPPLRHAHRRAHSARDPRRDGPDRIGRRRAQQVRCEGGVRSGQA